jgi:hypothetical protein
MAHRLSAGILRDHLGGVGRALSRAFETALSGARPSDHSPLLIRDAHDGIVETGLNVSDAMHDVLAAFSLDDLQRLDAVIEGKRDRRSGPGLLLVVLLAVFLATGADLGASFGAASVLAVGVAGATASDSLRFGAGAFFFSAAAASPSEGAGVSLVSSAIGILDFAGFCVGIALHADGLARALAGSRVGRGTLSPDRQSAPVADAAITVDGLEALKVALNFAAKVALDDNLERVDGVNDGV